MALTSAVLDTNVVISALLVPHALPAQVWYRIEDRGRLLASIETLAELEEVLRRPKFGRILSLRTREEFLRRFRQAAELVPVTSSIQACRDPRDDKFLELAIDGGAEAIVSGDEDLLVLDPFRGVRILNPRAFLEAIEAGAQ